MVTAAAVRNFQPSAGILTRSKGHSAAGKAAYNARTRIENERTGQVYDWTNHPNEIISQHFFAPANAPEWAKTREGYWNAVELREKRSDSQLAMDWVIPLPHELQQNPKDALLPLTDFIRENFQRRGYGADLSFHPPHDHGDERNFHAHLMVGIRGIDKNGEWKTVKDGVPDPAELDRLRDQMTNKLNAYLKKKGYDIELDHRSYEERGIDREPTIHLGKDASALERRGVQTEVGDLNRGIEARNREVADLQHLYEQNAPTVEDQRPEPEIDYDAWEREEASYAASENVPDYDEDLQYREVEEAYNRRLDERTTAPHPQEAEKQRDEIKRDPIQEHINRIERRYKKRLFWEEALRDLPHVSLGEEAQEPEPEAKPEPTPATENSIPEPKRPVDHEQDQADSLWQQVEAMRPHERAAFFELAEAQEIARTEAAARRQNLPQIDDGNAADTAFISKTDQLGKELDDQRRASRDFREYQDDKRAPAPVRITNTEAVSDGMARLATLQPLHRPIGKLFGRFAEMAAAVVEVAGNFLDNLFAPAEPTRLQLPQQPEARIEEPSPQIMQPQPRKEPARSIVDDILREAKPSQELQQRLNEYEARRELERRRRPPPSF